MAKNKLLGSLITATKQFQKGDIESVWRLAKTYQLPYDDTLYGHSFRTGTMPVTVKLYAPIVTAAMMWKGPCPSGVLSKGSAADYRMVSKHSIWKDGNGNTVKGKEYFLELLWATGESTVFWKKGNMIRISSVEADGTNNPVGEFKNLNEMAMAGIYLLCMPEILEEDQENAYGKLALKMDDLATFIPDMTTWQSAADIPDMAMESAFYMDAAFCYANDKAAWEFADASNPTASAAEQVPDDMLAQGFKGSEVVCSNPNIAFRFAVSNGQKDGGTGNGMTIAEAKAKFAAFSSHRKWNNYELMMIPYFAPDAPVMQETIFMANRIFGTRHSVIPVCNGMWCGVTGFGKSTGVRQLACILNMPLLIQTCHPGMEVGDFMSSFVPETEEDGLELDMTNVVTSVVCLSPLLEKAVKHLSQKQQAEREAFLSGTDFYMTAIMDPESAAFSLLGEDAAMDTEELCGLYTEAVCYFREAGLRAKISDLEAQIDGKVEKKEHKPGFKHVMSNYIKAMINGYIIEIQEPSRIRDSGVLVGLNEYDRAGAVIHLMNGGIGKRHEDAICIMTDNVG